MNILCKIVSVETWLILCHEYLTDINECLDTSICNGHGTCENTDGGFRCECFLQWTGKLCDDGILTFYQITKEK